MFVLYSRDFVLSRHRTLEAAKREGFREAGKRWDQLEIRNDSAPEIFVYHGRGMWDRILTNRPKISGRKANISQAIVHQDFDDDFCPSGAGSAAGDFGPG